jgi:hypothetical protein
LTLIHDARTPEHNIHMTYLPLAFKLFSKGMFSMFENFFKDYEIDRSFDDLKKCYEFCSKKCMLGKKYVLMEHVLSTQKRELLLSIQLYFDYDADIVSLRTHNWFHFTSLRLYIPSELIYWHVSKVQSLRCVLINSQMYSCPYAVFSNTLLLVSKRMQWSYTSTRFSSRKH